jgi:hypothetical protein
MVAVATLLFLLSTAVSFSLLSSDYHLLKSHKDMVLVIIEVEDGLVKYRDIPGGPAAIFTDFLQEIFIAKNVIYTLQTLLGDGVVVGSFSFANVKPS